MKTASTPSSNRQLHAWTVDVAGLIELLKQNTYRRNDVAVRELVANAADSFTQLLVGTTNQSAAEETEAAIRITTESFELTEGFDQLDERNPLEKRNRSRLKQCLVIEDNGIGMTREELHNIFGKVAAGAKRLLEKTLNPHLMRQDLIGRFGIGRLAAFLIANRMIVETCSRSDQGTAMRWEGTTSGYQIKESDRTKVGTRVILVLRKDLESEFLNHEVLRRIVTRDFRNVFYPIYIGEDRDPVNRLRAPWYEHDSDFLKLEQYDQYLRSLAASDTTFGDAENPLLIIPLEHGGAETDVHLRGVLYIPRDQNFSLKHHSSVEIYSRGVFVTQRDDRLIPIGLDFVKGVVESRDFTLNANRNEIQYDARFTQIQNAIRRTVLGCLMQLARGSDQHGKSLFAFIVQAHRGRIVQGACQDAALFDEVCEYIPFSTNNPDAPLTTLDIYLARSGKGRIEFTQRRATQGRLEPLLGDLEGDLIVVNDRDDVDLIQQYARRKAIEAHEIRSAAEVLANRLKSVPAPNDGWKDMVRFFDKELEHRDFKTRTRLCRMKNSHVPAAVSPDPKHDRGSFQDLILDDVHRREGDVEATRRDLPPNQGRHLILYLNVENEGLDRLARLMADDKGKASSFSDVLHEIFHYAMEFSEWPLALEHVCQQHTKMIKEFVIAVEAQGNHGGIRGRLQRAEDDRQRADDEKEQALTEVRDLRSREKTLKEQAEALRSELDLLRAKLPSSSKNVEHTLCFLAFPFRGYEHLVEALRQILERPPYYWQLIVASDVSLEPTIDENAMRHIRAADCYLAEISDLNSNVMMELGMMLMNPDRPLGLLCKPDSQETPANLKGYLTLNYGRAGLDGTDLVKELRALLRKDERFEPSVSTGERFLSPLLFSNEDEITSKVISAVTAHYKTVSGLVNADVDDIVQKTKLQRGSILNVRGILKQHMVP